MKMLLLTCCAAAVLTHSGWSQESDVERRPFQIGAINYFGYGGLPLKKVRSALPLHTGDTVTIATFSKKPINDAVASVIGKSPTDVSVVCCDGSRRLLIFIGLPGSTSRPVSASTAPSGGAQLDEKGLQLYEEEITANERAVAGGSARENDSQGYAVSNDPTLKAINLAMRAYGLEHEAELEHVLQTAGDPKQRRAAAALLGYTQRSQAQVEALSNAMSDPDDVVRNNAVRALAVLLAASGSDQLQINPKPLINLLYSGVWTDRNKASMLLLRMTNSKNPQILLAIKREAIGPLIEGGSWSGDPGHATPFLIILGRIGLIPDNRLNEMIKHDDVEGIISAATSFH